MFRFEFSNEKIISRNISTYPIDLAAVKLKSFFYMENPDDTTQDTYVSSVLIPAVISDWERTTQYQLLDQSIQAFVPNIQSINSSKLELPICSINVRNFDYFKYYKYDWDETLAKLELTTADYLLSQEINVTPISVRLRKDSTLLPLNFYQVTNNFECKFNAGFLDNDFTSMPQEIKDALAMQVAMAVDTKMGYCEDYYSVLIGDIYNKYTIEKPSISFI